MVDCQGCRRSRCWQAAYTAQDVHLRPALASLPARQGRLTLQWGCESTLFNCKRGMMRQRVMRFIVCQGSSSYRLLGSLHAYSGICGRQHAVLQRLWIAGSGRLQRLPRSCFAGMRLTCRLLAQGCAS